MPTRKEHDVTNNAPHPLQSGIPPDHLSLITDKMEYRCSNHAKSAKSILAKSDIRNFDFVLSQWFYDLQTDPRTSRNDGIRQSQTLITTSEETRPRDCPTVRTGSHSSRPLAEIYSPVQRGYIRVVHIQVFDGDVLLECSLDTQALTDEAAAPYTAISHTRSEWISIWYGKPRRTRAKTSRGAALPRPRAIS